MRPLKLSMSAFGPFPTTETVDFRTLGESPLFLINGPTGSGKTTILDAICYALYGKTTGDEREGHQMRCDQAASDLLTEVTFEFQLAGKRFRIRRVPEQLRPRLKGEGFTDQKPEAQLQAIDESGETRLLVARKTGEATQEIQLLTGLTADQFRQVIVLPQGKFRQLLLAESADREKILSQLFETQLYKKVEERLKEKAKVIADEVKQLELRRTALLETASVEMQAELEKEIEEQVGLLAELKAQLDIAEKESRLAQRRLSDGQKLEADFKLHKEAEMALSTLLAEESQYQKNVIKLEAAQAAQQLNPVAQERQRCRTERNAALSADEQCSRALAEAIGGLKAAEDNWQQQKLKKPQLEQIKQKQLALEGLLPRVVALKKAEETLKQSEGQLGLSRQKVTHLQDNQQQLEQQFKRDESDLKSQQAALQLLPLEEANLKERARLLRLKQALHKEQTALVLAQEMKVQLTTVLTAQQKETEVARQHHKTIALAWHTGQAALLAKTLEAGRPCPVCGSDEHPIPAESEQTLPTEAQLREAVEEADNFAEKVRALLNQQHAAARECEQIERKIREQLSELGEAAELETEVLEHQLGEMSQLVNKLLGSRKQLTTKEQALEALEDTLSQQKIAISEAAEQVTDWSNRQVAAQQDLENKQAELPEEQRIAGNIERDITQATAAWSQLAKVIDQADQEYRKSREALSHAEAQATVEKERLIRLQKLSDQVEKNWFEALSKSLFKNEELFMVAQQSADEMAQLTALIKRYNQQKLKAETTLKERAQRIEGKLPPALAELVVQEQVMLGKMKGATTDFHQKQARQQQLLDTQEKLTETAGQLVVLSERYKVVGRLSKVANGENSHNLSLQRFVLSVLLDDILMAATQRLKIMSKGRYQLIRKTEVTHRGRKAGLDLDVYDEYTGKSRPVATLSGGESFMAALSLALGLSDVVQGYSGGIQLDMLFIDEGFGSLDSDSLELAIKTLVDLQAVGRMVGVISHVPELKERISARIDLLANSAGSSIQLVTPGLNST